MVMVVVNDLKLTGLEVNTMCLYAQYCTDKPLGEDPKECLSCHLGEHEHADPKTMKSLRDEREEVRAACCKACKGLCFCS